jgi:predicted NAD/FAD-binding protein
MSTPLATAGLFLWRELVRKNLPNHGFLFGQSRGSAMPIQRQVPEISDEEIHKLLREIEGQSSRSAPDVRIKRPQSYSVATVTVGRELTLDEILQKIQRDIEQA